MFYFYKVAELPETMQLQKYTTPFLHTFFAFKSILC